MDVINQIGSYVGDLHNHPSGVALPSQEDIATTRLIRDALRTMNIQLVDHIVVADGDYVSMAASGMLI